VSQNRSQRTQDVTSWRPTLPTFAALPRRRQPASWSHLMSTQTALPTAPPPPVEPEAAEPPPKRRGGPKTPEGKRRARRNSLKRGLRSKILFPEDLAEIVEKRILDFTGEFAPKTPYEQMLVRDMATSSVRFERCASLAIADLVRLSNRA